MKRYRYIKLMLMFLFLLLPAHGGAAGERPECVVLLHGLARTEKSMARLEGHLQQRGFHVVNSGYPSREKDIQTLSIDTIHQAARECAQVNSVKTHFVTHSMGGILVRYYLERHELPGLGRVVMLSPPNKGSEVVDKLKTFTVFKWLNGPAGQQLGTDKKSIPNTIGPPYYEVGIITGNKSLNPILSLLITGKDDGKVSVERAKLLGMKDFLVVPNTHTFIMNDKKVIEQVIYFIAHGRFDRKSMPQ